MPSLSMATSLIAFGLLKAYTALMTRLGWKHAQFTPQACPRPRLPCNFLSLPVDCGCVSLSCCVNTHCAGWWHGRVRAPPLHCREALAVWWAGPHAVLAACITAP